MTMIVRFTQVRVEKEFGDEIRSQGTLFLAMPDLLRCEYEKPDPSVILFSGASFYQYVPSIAQVDKFTYSTVEEARERLRMLLLGFGVSGLEVEKSYAVSLIPAETPAPESVSGKSAGLAFVPLRDEIARDYSRILVWFSEKTLLPRHVRLIQVSGDETDVQIRDIRRDAPVADSLFKPEFPRGVEIIEHTAAQAPAPIRETIQMEDLK
jgi:outer membrane lipoprotein-sorting protein